MTEIHPDLRPERGASAARCQWCRRVLPPRQGPGRPKIFCSQRCRQSGWVSGQRSDELGLSENEMVIDRDQLDRLHDDLYALTCAIEDTERDLASGEERTVNELEAAIGWLLAAAKPVSEHQLGVNAHNRRYVN